MFADEADEVLEEFDGDGEREDFDAYEELNDFDADTDEALEEEFDAEAERGSETASDEEGEAILDAIEEEGGLDTPRVMHSLESTLGTPIADPLILPVRRPPSLVQRQQNPKHFATMCSMNSRGTQRQKSLKKVKVVLFDFGDKNHAYITSYQEGDEPFEKHRKIDYIK